MLAAAEAVGSGEHGDAPATPASGKKGVDASTRSAGWNACLLACGSKINATIG